MILLILDRAGGKCTIPRGAQQVGLAQGEVTESAGSMLVLELYISVLHFLTC